MRRASSLLASVLLVSPSLFPLGTRAWAALVKVMMGRTLHDSFQRSRQAVHSSHQSVERNLSSLNTLLCFRPVGSLIVFRARPIRMQPLLSISSVLAIPGKGCTMLVGEVSPMSQLKLSISQSMTKGNWAKYQAQGNYRIRLRGDTDPFISCSAPVFAAVIAGLNTIRLHRGLRPMGFLNPWLYGHASSALNDITLGRSAGCTGTDEFSFVATPFVPNAGWDATNGWDPVTGCVLRLDLCVYFAKSFCRLGTPNFPLLVEKMLLINESTAASTPV